jgi:hypothetical protein
VSRRVARAAAGAAFLLVIGALLAGCGKADEPQTPAAVAAAYREWDDSAIAGKADVACARMTKGFVRDSIAYAQSKAKDCEALMKETFTYAKQHPEIKNYTIKGITVDGNTAQLVDQTPYGNEIDTAQMFLVRVGGRWKVDKQVVLRQNGPRIAPPTGLTT